MTAFIVERFGFELLQLSDYNIHRAQSKWTHFRGLARQSMELLGSLARLRNCECIIAIGPISYLLKLLKRLRLIDYRQSICLGWHIRSPRWFPLFRVLSKLDGPIDHYFVFSEWEIELYRAHLAIDQPRMHYLPYGDWGPPAVLPESHPAYDVPEKEYYFSGGSSNRDYVSLIAAFRTIKAPLVIICSALNKELNDLDLPANVTVLRDLPSKRFDAYVQQSKACIIPLKHDTGASGQSVMLRLMRNCKLIIANDFGSLRGYVIDGVSGYLVRDIARDLPAIVTSIESNPGTAARLGKAAYQRYCDHFSPAAGEAALTRLLSSLVA
jgi:glycosyltransferase involved in cell wall biosynthesis